MTNSTGYSWSTEILHRHADGTEHAHAGRQGFTIGGQVITDTMGDDPTHSHRTLRWGTGESNNDDTGRVVWSERLGDIEDELADFQRAEADRMRAEINPDRHP